MFVCVSGSCSVVLANSGATLVGNLVHSRVFGKRDRRDTHLGSSLTAGRHMTNWLVLYEPCILPVEAFSHNKLILVLSLSSRLCTLLPNVCVAARGRFDKGGSSKVMTGKIACIVSIFFKYAYKSGFT